MSTLAYWPHTEKPAEKDVLCTVCRRSKWQEPLVVEWDEGSDLIGDFVFCGAGVVVRRTI